MNLGRMRAIAFKEATHIRRDPFTLIMAIIMPVFLVVLFGLALDLDVKNIKIGIDDRDQSYSSRRLISLFHESRSFIIAKQGHWSDAEREIRDENISAILVIPHDFEKKIKKGEAPLIQFVADGSDNAILGPALSYLYGIQLQMRQQLIETSFQPKVKIETRYLYNGELKSSYFIVPGLMSVVLAIVSILLTALTISREWENGSMELLLSTPTNPLELILGKILPYSIIGMLAVLLVYLTARLGFDIPFRGNHLFFLLACFLFLTAYLAQGTVISIVARSQAVAMQMAMVSGFLPTMLLSGFIFSISSMPPFFQYFTMILPARWFLQIVRTLFLKEAGFMEIWSPLLALLLINLVLVNVARKKFKRTLE
ncbi:MAG: ABC transporter permease [Oligoflexia bacterium]|nr:ABC transporter permease [Oligoflexia bacterium]